MYLVAAEPPATLRPCSLLQPFAFGSTVLCETVCAINGYTQLKDPAAHWPTGF